MARVSPPSLDMKYRWLTTASCFCPTSSASVNARPIAGEAPSSGKSAAVTDCCAIISGACPGAVTLTRKAGLIAVMSVKTCCRSRQYRKFAGATTFSMLPCPTLLSQTTTRRSGSL